MTKIKQILTKSSTIKEKAKESTKVFEKEIRQAVVTAITAAFAFIIALAWRDVITEFVNKITSVSPLRGKLFSAIMVTIISVIGILIVTKLTSPKLTSAELISTQ